MKITNSNYLVKRVKKDIKINDKEFNYLEISIRYVRTEKSYCVYFMPLNIKGGSTIILPSKIRSHRLLTIDRRSKSALKKAIGIFNNDIDEYIIYISPVYKTDFTKEDLYIDID